MGVATRLISNLEFSGGGSRFTRERGGDLGKVDEDAEESFSMRLVAAGCVKSLIYVGGRTNAPCTR